MPCHHGTKYANASEEDLMLWFYSCDDVAFEELWGCRLKNWVAKSVASEVSVREDVEDIVSEVALKLLETKRNPSARFNPQRGKLRPWVAGITLREIANHFRGQREATSINEFLKPDDEDEGEFPEVPQWMLADEYDEERKVIIRDAVRKLEEPSKTIVMLHFWEDLTQQEISEKLGIPLATVNRRLKHDLECLRKLLSQ